jgi:glycine cleavage system H protein
MNSDPYGEGWILKFKAADAGEFEGLLTAEEYEKFVEEEE